MALTDTAERTEAVAQAEAGLPVTSRVSEPTAVTTNDHLGLNGTSCSHNGILGVAPWPWAHKISPNREVPTNGKGTRTAGGTREIPECHTWVHARVPRNRTCRPMINAEAIPKTL